MLLIISIILFLGKALNAQYSFYWPVAFLIVHAIGSDLIDALEWLCRNVNKKK